MEILSVNPFIDSYCSETYLQTQRIEVSGGFNRGDRLYSVCHILVVCAVSHNCDCFLGAG